MEVSDAAVSSSNVLDGFLDALASSDSCEEQGEVGDDSKQAPEVVGSVFNQVCHNFCLQDRNELLSSFKSSAAKLGCAPKTLQANVHAVAESTLQLQIDLLHRVLGYVDARRSSSAQFLASVSHWLYDETPQVLRLGYETDETHKETAKVMVLERSWGLLLKASSGQASSSSSSETPEYLLLQGFFSPAVRAIERTNGEGIHRLLQTFPETKLLTEQSPLHIRLVETDAYGANMRAERLLAQDFKGMFTLHVPCLAHKIHSAAVRTWKLNDPLVASLVHCGLVLNSAGGMKKLRVAIRSILHTPGEVEVRHNAQLPASALAFKAHVLKLFGPPASEPRRKATILRITSLLMTGDWRKPKIEHICHPGCCRDEQDTIDKLAYALPRLATACNRGVFSKSNWSEWMEYWRFFGLLQALHGLLSKAFLLAFSTSSAENESREATEPQIVSTGVVFQDPLPELPVNLAAENKSDQIRESNARSLAVALRFLRSSWWDEFLRMRTSLEPQVHMMTRLLGSSSAETEFSRYMSFDDCGATSWTLFKALNTGWSDDALQESYEILACDTLYTNVAQTEIARTQIFATTVRPASVIFQLVHCLLENFPFELFKLIVDRTERKAEALLSTPKCRLDVFSMGFLSRFDTPDKLLSDDAHQVLCAIAAQMKLNTSSTERLHSVNGRAARSRVETHSIDIAHLGLQHMAFAGPSYLRKHKSADKLQVGRRTGRPNKRKFDNVADAGDHKKKRRGGGGAWRAFVSLLASN